MEDTHRDKKAKTTDASSGVNETTAFEGDVYDRSFFSEDRLNELRDSFRAAKPFPHAAFDGVFDPKFLGSVREHLARKEYYFPKSNDLYDLYQSDHLSKSAHAPVQQLRDVLYSKEWVGMLKHVTGIDLNDNMDLSCIRFVDKGNLLCHDDELDGRRIAFILYMVDEDWSKEDGGALDLYGVERDEDLADDIEEEQRGPSFLRMPVRVEKSVLPKWNNFIFFEVSPTSYHQVAEMLADDKERISISGWYYGESFERPRMRVEKEAILHAPFNGNNHVLSEWLSPDYLKDDAIETIKKTFGKKSSVKLPGFLKTDRFCQLREACQALQIPPSPHGLPHSSDKVAVSRCGASAWQWRGPFIKRSYHVLGSDPVRGDAEQETHRRTVQSFVDFLLSDVFVTHLHRLTGLDIETCRGETRRFGHQCFTLLHDEDASITKERLYASLCSGITTTTNATATSTASASAAISSSSSSSWNEEWGGFTSFQSDAQQEDEEEEAEEEELLRVVPMENSLDLVFCDVGCMSFVKYVNNHAGGHAITSLHMEYRENEEKMGMDDSDSDDDDDDESNDDESDDDKSGGAFIVEDE